MPFYKKNKSYIPRSKKLEQLTHKNGLRHIIFNPKGSSYRGEWTDDKKNGKGMYNGTPKPGAHQIHYEGDFKNGLFDGFGVMSINIQKTQDSLQSQPQSDLRVARIFRGEFRNGKYHGDGLRVFKDGSYYLGQWKDGKRHGFGQMWYADGSWFAGNWVNGSKDGVGVCVKKNGNRYEGTFYKGKRHGKGKFYFLNCGQVQEGIWYQDNCTVSTIKNLQFRQAALWPTKYPLPKLTLISPEKIYKMAQDKVLKEQKPSCEFLDNGIIKKLSVIIGE